MCGPHGGATDDAFLKRFEANEFPVGEFHHREHVHLAWIYLDRYPALEALQRFTSSLKAFVARHGAADKYHETVTWAFLFLINERRQRAGRSESWEEFAAANSDLLDWSADLLQRYYRAETLSSALARSTFVLPDRTQAGVAAPG